MNDSNKHTISEGVLETSKILMTQHFNFLENRIKVERRIKEMSDKGFVEEIRDLESLITSYNMFETGIHRNTNRLLQKMPIWNYFLGKVSGLDPTTAVGPNL